MECSASSPSSPHGGDVPKGMQIKVTSVEQKGEETEAGMDAAQGWIRCFGESFKLIFSLPLSTSEEGFFSVFCSGAWQHGLTAAFGTGLEETL